MYSKWNRKKTTEISCACCGREFWIDSISDFVFVYFENFSSISFQKNIWRWYGMNNEMQYIFKLTVCQAIVDAIVVTSTMANNIFHVLIVHRLTVFENFTCENILTTIYWNWLWNHFRNSCGATINEWISLRRRRSKCIENF